MQASLLAKLGRLVDRHEEIAALLSDPEVIGDQARFQALSREYAQLAPVVQAMDAYRAAEATIAEASELAGEDDPELRELAEAELATSRSRLAELEGELRVLLLPRDPRDEGNLFLEIRAGTGGDEAALFAGDLFRMYSRYAEERRWRLEPLSASPGEHGGFKEIICRVEGQGAYSRLKFESGVHRVQRVPETESQGRIHTSACTVAILPEEAAIDEIRIDPGDLRIDTFRSSGAGGQHVNTTDSAIRITHKPTGMVVECQDERSQHKNRDRAMALLRARLLDAERERQRADRSAERRDLVGSGDRSQRIRTYNFPQGRVTDHRINLTLYQLEDVLTGQLDVLVDPLTQEHQAAQLAALGAA